MCVCVCVCVYCEHYTLGYSSCYTPRYHSGLKLIDMTKIKGRLLPTLELCCEIPFSDFLTTETAMQVGPSING